MFSGAAINRAVAENILELKERTTTARDSELSTPVNLTNIFSGYLPPEYTYLAYKIDDNSKNNFSEWVVELPAERFEHFSPLFEILRTLIELN
jgi:hypothetical protein